MGKSRLWCFTNFDLEFDYEKYLKETTALYVAVGRETCPTSNRLHDQGWVYFEGQRGSIKGVAKQLGGCHVAMCRGNIDQNDDYCSKESELRTFGEKPKQGARLDIESAVSQIKSGERTVDQITLEQPEFYHQYGRTLSKIEDIVLRQRHRTWMTEGMWYWGRTGVGKSHQAFEGFSPETHYVYPNDGGWWDGYAGQETVILNEFRGEITFGELLDLVDKWPKQVRRRGREPVPFLARRVIITSSLAPQRLYKNVCDDQERIDQLLRRFQVQEILDQKCSEGNTEPLSQKYLAPKIVTRGMDFKKVDVFHPFYKDGGIDIDRMVVRVAREGGQATHP